MSERRLSDVGTALEAAAMLVRELRAVLDGLRAAPPAVASEPDPDTRATVELPRPPDGAATPAEEDEREEPEELTTVAARPPPGTPAASNGLRLAPRLTTPPPAAGKGAA
jgi:hypothetical protein